MGNHEMLKLHASLAVAQICFAGFEILTRTAVSDGANQLVFTLYRNILACIVLGPAAYFLERRNRPALSFSSVGILFVVGLLGVTINQLLYLVGLQYTSTVFASAMRNLTPIFTFMLAALLSIEEVHIKRRDGIAKICGCLMGLLGAVLLSKYHPSPSPSPSYAPSCVLQHSLFKAQLWELGGICLVLSFLAFSLSLILQCSMLKKFPAPLSVGALSSFLSSLQVGALGLISERHASSWRLTTSEILIVLYAGLIGSGLISGIQSWGVQKGGPVIVAAYQPLETVAVTLFYMLSGERMYLVSFIGIAFVFGGLYLLTWGQKEQKRLAAPSTIESRLDSDHHSSEHPLLSSENNC